MTHSTYYKLLKGLILTVLDLRVLACFDSLTIWWKKQNLKWNWKYLNSHIFPCRQLLRESDCKWMHLSNFKGQAGQKYYLIKSKNEVCYANSPAHGKILNCRQVRLNWDLFTHLHFLQELSNNLKKILRIDPRTRVILEPLI